jgi:protein-tyrosine phosphatase
MDNDNLAAVRQLTRGAATPARIEPITRYCRRHRVDEVPDPYYGGREGFEHVLDILEDACEGFLESLKPLTI